MTPTQLRPEFVTSTDATRIAYQRIGAGHPVVAIHGGLGTSKSWLPVAQRLADRFELLLVDRRGRGASGDGTPPHRLAKEVDDAQAVLEAAGPGANVIGHSYGGAVALEAARIANAGQIGRLVLYEPGVGLGGLIPTATIDRLQELVDDGQLEEALDLIIEQLDVAGIVRSDAAQAVPLANRPRRPDALIELARTVPREIRAVDTLDTDLTRYASIEIPILMLVGASSPSWQQRNAEALTAVLGNAQLVRLDKQGHVGHSRDPAQVAACIDSFLA
jgi:pimeloyl-ACP methyl ester carboxylesterase